MESGDLSAGTLCRRSWLARCNEAHERQVHFRPLRPTTHHASRVMIIDLERFITTGRPSWTELEKLLDRLETEPNVRLTLEQVRRFHSLYERTAADLARITTFSSEPETRRYLEHLVARAYGEIHETRDRRRRVYPLRWFFQTLPQTFRRHVRAFYLSVAITLAGCLFGGLAIALDPDAKPVLMPFSHLQGDPAKRVAEEEKLQGDR